jgi:hypothetical protein
VADIVSVAILLAALVIVGLLVSIWLHVRRPSQGSNAHEIGAHVTQSMQPYLQVLQPMKQQADQRLPLIEKYTSDMGQYMLATQKQRVEEDKLTRESLAKLQEMTKQTPEVAKQVAVLQNQLARLQGVEQGVQELTKLFLSTQGRGAMGEEAIRVQFQAMPHDMWSEQYPLGGGKVDFAVHMPNKRVLPIDSKTSGLQPILDYYAVAEKILQAKTPEEKDAFLREQGKLQTRIRQAVLTKTYEVAAYIQPENGTLGLAVQAVPDSLYGILDVKTRKEASEQHVQIVPYGLLLPIVHILRTQNQFDKLDFQAVVAAMQGVRLQTNVVRDVLVNKFEKAQKYLMSGIGDVEDALKAIDQNAETIGEAGPSPTEAEARLAIKHVRTKAFQQGLDAL